jgi:hypothetical protein
VARALLECCLISDTVISDTVIREESTYRTNEIWVSFERWMTRLERHEDSWVALSDGSIQQFVKLLLVDFLSCSVVFRDIEEWYWAWSPSTIDQENPGVCRHDVADMLAGRYSADCDDPTAWSHSLLDAESLLLGIEHDTSGMQYLLRSLDVAPRPSECDRSRRLAQRKFDLEAVCSQRLENGQRCVGRMNRKFEYANKVRNMEESISVKQFTILAAVFLPLSLAASLLGMQKRFKDLGVLLYDFIGAFLVVGTIGLLFVVAMQAAQKLKAQNSKFRRFTVLIDTRRRTTLFYAILALIFPVSFVVGMLNDTRLGAKILGYGLAASIAVIAFNASRGILGIAVTIALIILPDKLRWKRDHRSQKQQQQMEGVLTEMPGDHESRSGSASG